MFFYCPNPCNNGIIPLGNEEKARIGDRQTGALQAPRPSDSEIRNYSNTIINLCDMIIYYSKRKMAMSDFTGALGNPYLSPSFDRARTLSRILAVLFTIGFWLALALAICVPPLAVWPHAGSIKWDTYLIEFTGLSTARRAWLLAAVEVGMIPYLFLLHHARKLFGCFWRGEVFAIASVSHIRAAGFWLVISALAGMAAKIGIYSATNIKTDVELDERSLVFGIVTFIAAYVMAEARRLADENASIL